MNVAIGELTRKAGEADRRVTVLETVTSNQATQIAVSATREAQMIENAYQPSIVDLAVGTIKGVAGKIYYQPWASLVIGVTGTIAGLALASSTGQLEKDFGIASFHIRRDKERGRIGLVVSLRKKAEEPEH
jgi:hypothetical protein